MLLNLNDFSEVIANNANITKREAREQIDNVFEALSDIITCGDGLRVPSFGTFDVRYCEQRDAINPKTGEKIVVTAKYRPVFKFSSTFKKYVEQSEDLIDKLPEDE